MSGDEGDRAKYLCGKITFQQREQQVHRICEISMTSMSNYNKDVSSTGAELARRRLVDCKVRQEVTGPVHIGH